MKVLKYKTSDGKYENLYDTYKPDPYAELVNGYDYVDMGEAGIWATCNVGAIKPEETGLYFAWGETEGYPDASEDKKFDNDYNDYKFGNSNNFSKYNSTDGLKTLEPEDDAAHMNMGGSWRMPTHIEFLNLYDLCNAEWINNYNETGINGLLFKLKTDETKQLFFPACGMINAGSLIQKQFYGYYYSSTITSETSTSLLYFTSGTIKPQNSDNRYNGCSIRGFIPKSE